MIDPCTRLQQNQQNSNGAKGAPVRVFSNQSVNALSDTAVDCGRFNAVNLAVYVTGTNPSATISIEGSPEQGGIYLPLSDPNASQAAVSANNSFDVVVGASWVRVRISSISGTYKAGQGFTVIATPYVSPGQSRIEVTIESEPSGDGRYSDSVPHAVNVGTVSAQILASNSNRKYALIQNISDVDVFINLGNDAVVNGGFCKLISRIGSYEMSQKQGNLNTAAIHAIHNGTGNKVLLVTEGT